MGQASVTQRYRFCAAHRLHTDYLSPQENLAVFGKCNNPNGHGHNYVVLVTVRNSAQSETGGGVDLGRLDQIVGEQVITRFDHCDLNQDSEFADRTTTGENLVMLIWDLLVPYLPDGQLEKVGLIETRDNYFEYAGATNQAPVLREGRHG